MKTVFVRDLKRGAKPEGTIVTLHGWIKARRDKGQIVFLDVSDSTGSIQIVVRSDLVIDGDALAAAPVATQSGTTMISTVFSTAETIALESAVSVTGAMARGEHGFEIHAESIEVVGEAIRKFSPRPRSKINILDGNLADHLLRHRHLYIRNEKMAAILRFRHLLMGAVNNWFRQNEYVEITAPVLTPVPLYEDGTALKLRVDNEDIFLTQCVGFYLESAVHAFEKVYNMGPSFRAEESRSKRHLMEYWHIKAEIAWVDLNDLIEIVEDLISHLAEYALEECSDIAEVLGTAICAHGLATPFPRIGYTEAIDRLQKMGNPIEFGDSLGSQEEEILSRQFISPFWVTGIPRKIEPFPYVIDKVDNRLTRTADLIATGGYGELLGVAEKIHKLSELDERMLEKGKLNDPRYDWVRQLRQFGCVPHGGFGMGFERLIRWILGIPHVRDTIPFPRIFRRKVTP